MRLAAEKGLAVIEDSSLDQKGLLVFAMPDDPTMVARARSLFRGLAHTIKEYRGVLSVPTGSFYLRFNKGVSNSEARRRIRALGFKVTTPMSDTTTLLVVEGTGYPGERDRELAILKGLPDSSVRRTG